MTLTCFFIKHKPVQSGVECLPSHAVSTSLLIKSACLKLAKQKLDVVQFVVFHTELKPV